MKAYSDDEEETITDTKSSDCVISITKVSKLNPNVDEFIPKHVKSDRQTSPSNNVSTNLNVVPQVSDKKTNVAESLEKDNNIESDHKSTDVNSGSIRIDEYEEVTTKLKNKISDAAKYDSFEFKKQKNVAIATLLRLYADKKSPSNETDGIQLLKPDFFKSSYHVCSSSRSTPEPKDCTKIIPSDSSASLTCTPAQSPSEDNSNESNTTKPKVKLDPEIRNSIEKVNKWLEEPGKKNSKPVYLGPIAFKRKQIEPSPSPPVSETKESPKRKISNDKQQYKPSVYASDLGKKYMERNKILEAKQNEVTWSNLEQILKQKDTLIKKRLQEQQRRDDESSCE